MTRRTPYFRGIKVGGVETRQPWIPPDRPEWMTDTGRRCSPTRKDAWEWTSNEEQDRTRAARKCREHCPFLAECLAWAVENGENYMVWGGLDLSTAAGRKQAAASAQPKPKRRPSRVKRTDLSTGTVSPRPNPREHLDQIRAMWEQDRSDADIGLHIGVHPSTVSYLRKHVLGLPAKFGPGGSRRKVAAA